jgi:hypothetical protein
MPHDPLDSFLDDLRSAATDTPIPAVRDELAVLFRDGAAPVVSPAAVPRRRRWSVRTAVAGAVAGVTFGGLGIAGALPTPFQHQVAGVARHVGVELPDPETTTTTVTVPQPAVIRPTPTTAPRSDDNGGSTLEPGDDRRGTNSGSDGGDERSGSDGGSTTPTTSDVHGDDGGSNRGKDGGGDSGSSGSSGSDSTSSSNSGPSSGSTTSGNDSGGHSG